MNWLYYLAEANVYIGVFYLAYCLLLNRDTHYQLSRAYLILACIVSFILPLLQFSSLRPIEPVEPAANFTYTMQPVTAEPPVVKLPVPPPPPSPMVTEAVAPIRESSYHFTLQDGLWYAYLSGTAVLLVLLFIKLFTLFKLTRNGKSVKEQNYRVIYLNETDVIFSFFNYVFIGTDAPLSNTIIRHELVHIRQRHTADIIFLELIKVISWFNPFVYLLQNSLKTVHEYIADEHTAAYETDALTYSAILLNSAYGAGGSSLTHSFFNYNLLKKRIIMLNQQRSGNLARLKYLVALPICAALICTSTLVFSKTYGWIDLAPAHAKTTGRIDMLTGNHHVAHKHLKITHNGVTTIADRIAVAQKDKNVVYTAASITKADKLQLLRNHNLKIEVVSDSTMFTTKDGQLILPVVNVDGYYLLDHFLHNNIHFNPTKGDKGGLVEVGFDLDKDRHIQNLKVVKSGGDKLDALALNGFNAYKGIVNDDPGKSLKLGVYFFTNDYSIFKTDSLGKDPQFGGELIITSFKYPVTRTSKGYEYDESGVGFPGDNNNMSYAKVLIYDKNGDANWFFRNKCTPADLKLLQDKYGYTFPSAASEIVQFMYPKNVKKHLAYIFDVTSYLEAPYGNQFYNHMLDNTEYPQQAKKDLAGGAVVLNFNLDNEGTISDIKVAQSAGNGFDEAAVKAMQAYKAPINDAAGKHSIAILFCVAENKYRPLVSQKMKKDGYVGELAICNAKSPFVNGTAKYTPPAGAPGSSKN